MGDLLRGLLKGAIGPADNDSRFLLDVHRATCPARRPCAAIATTTRSTWWSSVPARAARCSRSAWRARAGGS